jgi:hypothetical protein
MTKGLKEVDNSNLMKLKAYMHSIQSEEFEAGTYIATVNENGRVVEVYYIAEILQDNELEVDLSVQLVASTRPDDLVNGRLNTLDTLNIKKGETFKGVIISTMQLNQHLSGDSTGFSREYYVAAAQALEDHLIRKGVANDGRKFCATYRSCIIYLRTAAGFPDDYKEAKKQLTGLINTFSGKFYTKGGYVMMGVEKFNNEAQKVEPVRKITCNWEMFCRGAMLVLQSFGIEVE